MSSVSPEVFQFHFTVTYTWVQLEILRIILRLASWNLLWPICHESGKGSSLSCGGNGFIWQTYLSNVLFITVSHASSLALPAPLMAALWIIKHSCKEEKQHRKWELFILLSSKSQRWVFLLVVWLNWRDQISHHQHQDVLFVLLVLLRVRCAWLPYTCDPVTGIPSLISKDDHNCNVIMWHRLKGLSLI